MCVEIGVVIKLECVILIASFRMKTSKLSNHVVFIVYQGYPGNFPVPVEDNIISSL